ncbi:HNH endonuclease [uncultured Herbaspirillum sp.]|uniref:HNH endonuclease n=1 Tax=uncultured Herbaspirillum sp. TaxID=160236 RepID=UPI002590BC5A|nr:HNH endonuclease [uncultured Herbaspirillum sp.]
MATWIEDIVTALSNLGGAASYENIYREIARIRGEKLPDSWRQIVQREIQAHAGESSGFKGRSIFYSVKGKGGGEWGLLSRREGGIPSTTFSTQQSKSIEDTSDGLKAIRLRNKAWSRDELILALHLYLNSQDAPLSKESREVKELSQFLNQMNHALGGAHSATYRNANGVYMKLMNFRRFDPHYKAEGKVGLTRGNKDEQYVWNKFSSDPKQLAQVAAAIRLAVVDSSSFSDLDVEPDIIEAEEGSVLTKLHRVRERKRGLVEQRKRLALKTHGRLFCEACGFEFSAFYGEIGRGLIDVHHTKPVHTLRAGDKTRLEDLALLCANCHRVVHSSRRWLSVDEVRAAVLLRASTGVI